MSEQISQPSGAIAGTQTTGGARLLQRIRKSIRRPQDLGGLVMLAFSLLISRWKLRRCTRVGLGARVVGPIRIENEGQLHIGERARFRGSHVPVELATTPGGVLTIGEGCYINSGTSIAAAQEVRIGKHVAIGNYVLIMDSDFHDVNDHRKSGKSAPIIIEDNVWIAARVTILKGVRIGQGAVVAAGAVVTKDVPPRSLVGGVPARVLRLLPANPEETQTVSGEDA